MTTAAEYRRDLAAFESSLPTLQRVLKAAVAGASMLDALKAQQEQLEKNIAGLKTREERAQEAAKGAKEQAERATKAGEELTAHLALREKALQEGIARLEARIKGLTAESSQATRHLAELQQAVKDAELKAKLERERATRIAAAVAEAAR